MATAASPAPVLSTKRGKQILALVCAVAFLDFADASIVNVALPSIREDLHFSVQNLQWVLSGYLLTYGGFMLLGGRAAEWIVFEHLSTGAADDLVKVTDIARAMVTRYGMTERLGHVALEKDRRSFLATDQPYYGPQERDYSDETAAAVDEEVKRIVEETFGRTVALLQERREILDASSRLLLERETLGEEELRAILRKDAAELSQKTG